MGEDEPVGAAPNKSSYSCLLLSRLPIDSLRLTVTALAVGRYAMQHDLGKTLLATGFCLGAINTSRIAHAQLYKGAIPI